MTKERVEALRPEDVVGEKLRTLPGEVLEAFNELISQDYVGGRATVLQNEVVRLMVAKGLSRADIFKNGWLDVEEIYRAAGWKVEYDKPGYNESYEPSFTFIRRRRSIED